jgi:hypothetical protein
MFDISEDLHMAACKIAQDNNAFVKEMRTKYRNVDVNSIDDSKMHNLLSKDIHTLEEEDRVYIKDRLTKNAF